MGDLGNIIADKAGRALFRFQNNDIKISDIIGRSLVVTENEDDLGKGENLNSKIDGNSGSKYLDMINTLLYIILTFKIIY